MSSARLEVIKDDAETPACMSRSMPAALDGLLTQTALDGFCDKLDELFVLSHAEFKRVIKRVTWLFGAFYFWLFIIVSFSINSLLNPNLWWFIVTFILTAVYIGIVWMVTQPGAGTKSSKEILQLIRFECDDMTRRTPFVSFHVAAGVITHIGVSISLSATASGVARTSNATMEQTSDSKVDESSDNHHPVVYAQAVTSSTATSGNYQQLNDVEVV
jgi:hypothetical protein